jgi:aldehyde dehydrogenase (NAD+)
MLDRPAKLKAYQTFIDGNWSDAASASRLRPSHPYTGEAWATIPECDKVDVDRACQAAARAFEVGPWPAMSATARGKIMRRIAGLIEKHAQHLAEIEVRDNGKLMSEMHAQTKYLPEWFYYYGGLADKIQGAVVPADRPDHFNYILREPIGVCAFITPWNSPLMLVGWKLRAGAGGRLHRGFEALGISPSASLLEFIKLVIEPAELPPGVVNVVNRLWRRGRRAAGDASQGRQGRLHRWHGTGARVNELGRQDLQEGVAGARRQVAQYRVR